MVVRRARLAVKPNVGRRGGAKPAETKKEDNAPSVTVASELDAPDAATASTASTVAETAPSTSQPTPTKVSPIRPSISRIRTRSCSDQTSPSEKSDLVTATSPEKVPLLQSPRRRTSSQSQDNIAPSSTCETSPAKKPVTPVKPKPLPAEDTTDGGGARKRKISFSSGSNSAPTPTESVPKSNKQTPKSPEPVTQDPTDVKTTAKPAARRFIRAKPNLSEAGRPRLRHPSKSSTEPSEESRRTSITEKTLVSSECPKSPRAVNNDVTKSGSTAVSDDVSSEASPEKPAPSNKPNNSDESQTRSPPPGDSIIPVVRKRVLRKTAILDKPVDRSKMTISDLIYMNPTTNRMKSAVEEEEKKKEKRRKKGNGQDDDTMSVVSMATEADKDVGQLKDVDGDVEDITDEGRKDEEEKAAEEEEEEEAVPVPQVTIGPDGNIVLNEQSLVVEAPKDNNVNDFEVVHEDSNSGGYGYNRRMNSKLWTLNETKKFYLALSAIGTDFSLMCKLFQNRTRTEIKRKFKKEERCNKPLIDKAIRERHLFDEHFFAELSALDVDQENQKEKDEKKKKAQQAKQRSRKKQLKVTTAANEDVPAPQPAKKPVKKKRGRKKSLLLYEESDSEAEAESSQSERLIDNKARNKDGEVVLSEGEDDSWSGVTKRHVPGPMQNDDNDTDADQYDFTALEDKEVEVIDVIHGPTRSGRLPKPAKPFTVSSPESKRRKTDEQGPLSPFVMPSERTRRASGQKMPGQCISLSNIASNKSTDQMQPGSLVFVTSSPAHKGEASPGMIHVYLVAPPDSSSSGDAAPSTSQWGAPGESLLQANYKVTPGGDSSQEPETIVIDGADEANAGSEDEEQGATLIIDMETGTAECVKEAENEEGEEEEENRKEPILVARWEDESATATGSMPSSATDTTENNNSALTVSEVPFVPPPCNSSSKVKKENAIALVPDLLRCTPPIHDESPSKKVVYDVADELVITDT